ncbi:mRNA interferase PemK, partial [Methylotuvimicrobium alcaliphilum]|uniref:PemK-like protein 2 n=1 Tax=Methylotuvimicrobium alcaliphilum (strain DSM 19304 / NCIMB 14124 / VKM B-2133 / 20Z) TaxID=1091494 RepID=G4T324_META2
MGLETQGVVLVNDIRSLDPIARRAVYIEKADAVVIDECLAKLEAILGYEAK